MTKTVPTKAIAKLGLILGQSKRRGRDYITLPVDAAKAVHDYLVAVRQEEYIKQYRKL